MRQAKAFFFVAAGILMLVGAFHLGAQTAQGQAGSPVVGIAGFANSGLGVVTENGDFYSAGYANPSVGPFTWQFQGNILSGAPVQSTETTWGRIKADRR